VAGGAGEVSGSNEAGGEEMSPPSRFGQDQRHANAASPIFRQSAEDTSTCMRKPKCPARCGRTLQRKFVSRRSARRTPRPSLSGVGKSSPATRALALVPADQGRKRRRLRQGLASCCHDLQPRSYQIILGADSLRSHESLPYKRVRIGPRGATAVLIRSTGARKRPIPGVSVASAELWQV
jgi:hypothetical protein